MRAALFLVIPALCAGFASSAWADKDKDKGKHGKGRSEAVVVQPVRVVVPDRDRTIVYTYYRTEFASRPCPPGLAKKGNGCFPPGPPNRVWVVGRPLPPTVVYEPAPPVLVQQLEPVPPGYGYVRVDNDVLLMNMADRLIAATVMDLSGLD